MDIKDFKERQACKEAIEAAIRLNYSDNVLDSDVVLGAVEAEFSRDCIEYVLANTVKEKKWDGRISRANKEWAETISIAPIVDSWGGDRNCYLVLESHPILIDAIVTQFRARGGK